MAQRQFRTDDTSAWAERFGDGSGGSYAPGTSTDAPIDSACTGTINTTSLTATNASFAGGQLILIHQTTGTGAGQWELNKISSYSAGTITTSYSLIYGYASGAQVLVMPQYSSGNIAGGVTLTGKAWDGSVGGIFAKFSNGAFDIAGTLTLADKGYRAASGSNPIGTQGEGYTGTGSASTSANGNGGGGGNYITAGGTGGASVGVANNTTLFFGGASGGGGGSSTVGKNGGGVILIIAKTITVSGTVVTNGTNGSNGATDTASTGGGAGGGVLLKGQTITLGSGLITATGGTAGTGGVNARGSGGGGYGTAGTTAPGANSGAGGVGRIHADYSGTLSGTTSPTIDTSVDSIFADSASSGASFIYNFI